MNKVRIALNYDIEFLESERPQPLSDNKIDLLIQDVLSGKLDKDITDNVYENFKYEIEQWIFNSRLNSLKGIETFFRKDICIGCTQYIDNLYMLGPVQVLQGDYKYHERLGLSNIVEPNNLIPNMPLIVAMPFPAIGAPHVEMHDILEQAIKKNIPVHIDGAWVTCCKDITFNFDHPAIQSVAISLSKGAGLGWNRIGLRWSKTYKKDSITIMNDFQMNNRALVMIGLHFIRNLQTDYLWTTHSKRYYKICNDFDLTPTKSIYLAMKNNNPVGISPLIRYLENND